MRALLFAALLAGCSSAGHTVRDGDGAVPDASPLVAPDAGTVPDSGAEKPMYFLALDGTSTVSPWTGSKVGLMIGDSVISGGGTTSQNGPRKPLYLNFLTDQSNGLVNQSLTLSFVGPLATGDVGSVWYHHDGVSGAGVVYHLAHDAVDLAPYKPDFILVYVGGQECNINQPQQAIDNYIPLIQLYRSMWPAARIMVSNIIAHTSVQASVDIWNAALPGLWDQINALGIPLIRGNANVLIEPTDYEPDMAHPNDATGNPKIAQSWRVPFRNLLGYP